MGTPQVSEINNKKYFKKNPEKLPENQIIITNFRKQMVLEYLKEFIQPLDAKKEKELLDIFIKETTAELGLLEIKNQYHHIISFTDKFLQILEQLSTEIKHRDIIKQLRSKYLEIQDWTRRVNLKYQTPKFHNLKEDLVDDSYYNDYFQTFLDKRKQLKEDLEDKRIWQFLEKNPDLKSQYLKVEEISAGPPIIGQFHADFITQNEIDVDSNCNTANNKELLDLNEEEVEEYTPTTMDIGHRYLKELTPTINEISTRRISRNQDNQTIRIGQKYESSIIEEYWNYYQQFSINKLPNPGEYYGLQEAELKISLLIDLFQDFYLESIYPIANLFPIIHFRFIQSDTKKAIPAKIFLVADTHGSFKDTIKMINKFVLEIENGKKVNREVKVIFIGDFVDRNPLDIHNLIYIMTFNLKYPKNVLLLRGNHEEMTVNANYGFGNNILKNFSKVLYASINNCFKDLPLIAIIHCPEGNIGVLHGGIPLITNDATNNCSLDSFNVPDLHHWKFDNRHINLDELDPVTAQILWNDPIDNFEATEELFYSNSRGMGYKFGKVVFDVFCQKNNVQLIFRGHQVFQDGICKFFDDRLISFFSAHEYGKSRIKAKFIEIDSADIFNYQVHDINPTL